MLLWNSIVPFHKSLKFTFQKNKYLLKENYKKRVEKEEVKKKENLKTQISKFKIIEIKNHRL